MKKEMMMDLDKMEAERGEIKETTREEMQALAMKTAEACFNSTLESIGKRLTQKRRADAMGALQRVRLHLIRNADTTAKDVRAAIKVLRIVEETGQTDATAMEFIKMANAGEWKHVPETLRALLNRLGYFVDYDDAEETTEATETTEETTEATETTEEPKTIAQRFAEKRAERESFEAFKTEYFINHPSIAEHFRGCVRVLEGVDSLIKEVRRQIKAAQRGDEMAAHGPAGIGPNGLPLYYVEGFERVEAPEYLRRLEYQRAHTITDAKRIMDKIRKAYEEETPETRAAAEAEAAKRAAAELLDVCSELTPKEATRFILSRPPQWIESLEKFNKMNTEAQKKAQPEEETTEQPAEATESTQSDRARAAYLNTCDECEAIEATGTREAVHEAKKLRTLAAEALAHFLRTHAPEWVEELETLQREAFEYSPDSRQDQRRGAEGIGYRPIN